MVINQYILLDVDKFKESGYEILGKIVRFESVDLHPDIYEYAKKLGYDVKEFKEAEYPVFRTKKLIPQEYLDNNQDVIIQEPIDIEIHEWYTVDFSRKVYKLMEKEGYRVDNMFAYNIMHRFGGNVEPQRKEMYDVEAVNEETPDDLSTIKINQWHSGRACTHACVYTTGIRKADGTLEVWDWVYEDETEYDRNKRTEFFGMELYCEVFNEDGVLVYDSGVHYNFYDDFAKMELEAECMVDRFKDEEEKLEREFDDYLAKDYYYEIYAKEEGSFWFYSQSTGRNSSEVLRSDFDKNWNIPQIVRDNM